MNPIRLAIVGFGKIAGDQHLPALAADSNFDLVAVADPRNQRAGLRNFPSIETMLDASPDIEAVSICTTPQVRYEIARYALEHDCHVMLEKPPCATLSEVAALTQLAESKRLSLFASWHSREAGAVELAREWLSTRRIRSVAVIWKEDVRVWHPGQTWIWQAGGLGVFDPGINALSIATRILPGPLTLENATLHIPSNCSSPIAAELDLNTQGIPVRAEFDFRQTGPQSWDIDIETDSGRLLLSNGGSFMRVNGKTVIEAADREYANLYARFATLVRQRRVDVDITPLCLVAEAFSRGRRVIVEPFNE